MPTNGSQQIDPNKWMPNNVCQKMDAKKWSADGRREMTAASGRRERTAAGQRAVWWMPKRVLFVLKTKTRFVDLMFVRGNKLRTQKCLTNKQHDLFN